jgi:hypothetical protein
LFDIRLDRENHLISFRLDGPVDAREMREFVDRLRAEALVLLPGHINVLADMRGLSGGAAIYREVIAEVQRFGIRIGVRRVAELVSDAGLGEALAQAARASGTDRILRRFEDEATARAWVISEAP